MAKFTKEEIEKMSVSELLRYGFEQLDEQTENDIMEKMKQTEDENELKRLQGKLQDVERFKAEDKEKHEETQAEAMQKRMEQRQQNDKIKQAIKRYVVDGKTGELVEVLPNIET